MTVASHKGVVMPRNKPYDYGCLCISRFITFMTYHRHFLPTVYRMDQKTALLLFLNKLCYNVS